MALCVLVITGCAAHKPSLETGLQLVQQRQFDQAHDALLAFAAAQPAHEDAALALYTAARIRILHRDARAEGEALLEDLLERYPADRWAFHAALKLLEARQDPEAPATAVPYCDHALRIGPQVYPPVTRSTDPLFAVYGQCAAIYTGAGDPARAEPLLAELLAAGIDDHRQMPPLYARYAEAIEAQERPVEAAEAYLELIRRYPSSDPAKALLETPEKIEGHAVFAWEPYRHFVEGVDSMRTYSPTAVERLSSLEALDAPPELVRNAHALLPWAHLFGNDYDLAEQAYADFRERYPGQPEPSVLRSLPMYLAAYRTDYEFKQYLTGMAVLGAMETPADETSAEEEYQWATGAGAWQVLDLTARLGYYDHTRTLGRPAEAGDRAYLRFQVKAEGDAPLRLEVDNDDPWTVWVDGAMSGPFEGGGEPLALPAGEGWRDVVVRLDQVEGPMVTTLRLVDADGKTRSDVEVRPGPVVDAAEGEE